MGFGPMASPKFNKWGRSQAYKLTAVCCYACPTFRDMGGEPWKDFRRADLQVWWRRTSVRSQLCSVKLPNLIERSIPVTYFIIVSLYCFTFMLSCVCCHSCDHHFCLWICRFSCSLIRIGQYPVSCWASSCLQVLSSVLRSVFILVGLLPPYEDKYSVIYRWLNSESLLWQFSAPLLQCS